MAVVAQLAITMEDNGLVNITGSIDNKVLAYGLLETAKDMIQKHHVDKERLVQPASVVPFPTRNNN